METQKVKASRQEFTEVLYYWLAGFLTKEAVKKTAKDSGFKIRNDEDS